MKITSSAFVDGGYIPAKYSKQGGNVSPPLGFVNVPTGAKSLAFVCHDPDAPVTGGFTHWVVWGIDPMITEITEGNLPAGAVQGTSDWKTHVWGGPQPPSGVHRYNFHLYALDTTLNLPVDTTRDLLEGAMEGHILDMATVTGLFGA